VLIDQGHPATHDYSSGADLAFRSLEADLFAPAATTLIDEVKLGNEAVQQILRHLLLTKAKRGTDRGFISYAELGINQLGAVYEGLMSYSGSFAAEDQYEVATDGNPEKGTWVLPASRVDDIERQHLVMERDAETGEPRPVLHRRGTFVYRLAGRERQQSASYYTPEVLTRSVVSHSLAELLDQNDTQTDAIGILRFTICEPALGSGAFAIEAVRQLAAEYLKRRQREIGEPIPAEDYPAQLQKVKAYLALHQVYGVDLNATAVELAEVSLWLDTMYEGLRAPWFGLHLRRGNSLIGARHAFYSVGSDLPKKAWLKTVPVDVALTDDYQPTGRLQHFLLPAEGWGAGADTAEARTYAPQARESLRAWRAAIRSVPSKPDQKRLESLARRVETLWQLTLRRLTIAEAEIRRPIDVWGAAGSLPEATGAVTRPQIEKVLHNADGAYLRLRRIMDAWGALWFWPVTERLDAAGQPIAPPSWADWLGALESIVGIEGRAPGVKISADQGSFGEHSSWDELDQAEELDLGFHGAQPSALTSERFPWLQVSDQIAREQGFFHWDLDFAPVFSCGGFDLQVGNPPWVRPRWDETAVLAEEDPWWQITDKPAETDKGVRRQNTLQLDGALGRYLNERTSVAGMSAHLGSDVDRPVLSGLQPDLYRCFMERTWRSMASNGVVGLIHPESHFTEADAGRLRKETYGRLRRHWQYRNEKRLFEIHHAKEYGVHIYGSATSPSFMQASYLFEPESVDRSLIHDGSGPPPGVKDAAGNWDLRPHRERIVHVDSTTLERWALLIGGAGSPSAEARMLYPVNLASALVLDKISAAPRISELEFDWTRGWEEDQDRKRGYFVGGSGISDTWPDVILQGPHLTVGNPLYQQPNESMRSNKDHASIDLEALTQAFIPRTNYQRAIPASQYEAAYPKWGDQPSNTYFRLAWREMCDSATVRTLHSAILPPGPAHVGGILSLATPDATDLAVAAGTTASIVADFMIKVIGVGHVKVGTLGSLPHVRGHDLEPQLILRALRLNCLIREYAPLWEELYDSAWQRDAWVPEVGAPYPSRPELGDVTPEWTMATPLRRDADRRQALVEIDAIVAVMLGITADELATIYRTQFPVLQAYERDALYDSNGRQVPREIAKAYRKNVAEGGPSLPASQRTGEKYTYDLPFAGVDREPDLRLAHAHFSRLSKPIGPVGSVQEAAH
jgi:hypothetical protein